MSGTWLPPVAATAAVPRLAEELRRTWSAEPSGVWAAPGRVNLIGEHLDYNDGPCLPLALPHRTFVAAARRSDDAVRLRSLQQSDVWEGRLDDVRPGAVSGWAAYAAGVLWALREDGFDVPGLDLVVDGTVPVGSGLSSSAALECAVALAAAELAGADAGGEAADLRRRLAASCVRAENEVAGAPTGGMDQAVALLATEGHALLLDAADGSTSQVPLELGAAGLTLLVVDTRAPHRLVDGQYAQRREACRAAAEAFGAPNLRVVADTVLGDTVLGDAVLGDERALEPTLERLDDPVLRRRARHVLSEVHRVTETVRALRAGRWQQVGSLLDASHDSLRDDFEVSSPELDAAVDAARAAGAWGARMTGGGFGGSAVALVRTEDVDAVAGAVVEAFGRSSLGTPAFLLAEPSAAGGRLA